MYHEEQGCTFSYKNTNFPLYFGQENRIFLVTRNVLWPKIYRKCDSGRGFAPDPAGGAHDAPPDPVVGWGADTPPWLKVKSLALALYRSRCSHHYAAIDWLPLGRSVFE